MIKKEGMGRVCSGYMPQAQILLQNVPLTDALGRGSCLCVQERKGRARRGKGTEHPLNLFLPQLAACWGKPSGFCVVGLGFVTLFALALR